MKKKKVLVDLFYLNTALTGIKTYMLEFCEAVRESDQEEIEFIFTHDVHRQASDKTFRGNVSYWRKLFYHVYYFWWKQFVLPFRVWKASAGVLICFDFVAPAFPIKARKLTVVHDAFFWQMPQNYNPIWRAYFLKIILWGLNGESTVVTTSHYSKKSLLENANFNRPIAVIYQCPKLLKSAEDRGVLSNLGLKAKKYLLHIGSFDRRKLLPVLVEAFGMFDKSNPGNLKLVLVGERGLSTALDDYDQVLEKIEQNSLESEVFLPGFLPDASVKALYQNAFAYVFPSSNEGFGIPIIEAMENQIPVIISDQEALVEIAGGAALVSKTGQSGDLAGKIEMLYKDPSLCQQLIGMGNERRKDFSRQAFLDGFMKILLV